VNLDRVVLQQSENPPQTDLVEETMDTPAAAMVLMVNAVPSLAGGELAPVII
jgi:hypothetical protein